MQNLISTSDNTNINLIYNEMDRYWKYKNDFIEGILLYLKDLNKKHELGLNENDIIEFSGKITTKLLMEELSKKNTLYVIAQFICYTFFEGHIPYSKQVNMIGIFGKLDEIEATFIYTDLKDGLRIKIDRDMYLSDSKKVEHNKPVEKTNAVLYGVGFGAVMAIIAGFLAESQSGGADFADSLLPGFGIGFVIGLIYGYNTN
jgi:hypothetical protein